MISFLFLVLLQSGTVHAEANARQFIAQHQRATAGGRKYLVGYVNGLTTGYTWANMALKAKNQKPMFCIEAVGMLEHERVLRMVKMMMNEDPRLGDTPIGMAILTVMIRRFPCKDMPKDGEEDDEPME